MRRSQLLKWSGTVLSPRPRGVYVFQHRTSKHDCRNAASAAAIAQSSRSELESRPPPRNDPYQYRYLPSPPPSSARQSARLSALHARLHLASRLPIETLGRCLIDPSADLHPSFNNSSLSVLGDDILGYHALELILCRYPRLPMGVIFAAMKAYVGRSTLATITKEWGVEVAAVPGGEVDAGLLQYKRLIPGNAEAEDGTGNLVKNELQEQEEHIRKPWRKGIGSHSTLNSYFGETETRLSPQDGARNAARYGITHEAACLSFVRAVFGAVYLHSGRAAAKSFFNAHIGSRKLDVSQLFEFKQPTRDLSRLCAREGFEAPVARILSESGRFSRTPVYVVGVFSGTEKLGEGTGASLNEARNRGAINALKGWYLYSPLEMRVPSDVEGGGKEWKPVLIDGGEVIV